MSETIGVVGLGLIGSVVVARLGAAGYQVIGFDPAVPKLDSMATAANPSKVFASSGTVILCLPDSNVAHAVLDEAQFAIQEHHLIINTTTGGAEAPHPQMIEATIGGSSAMLRDGNALLFLGGTEARVARAQPILDALSSRCFHLGAFGAGAKFKLVHNMAIGLNRAVVAETLQFAEALGFDPNQSLDILQQSAASSTAMKAKGAKMLAADYEPPQARLSQHLKDVRLMLAAAQKTTAKTPLKQLHEELLALAESRGYGKAGYGKAGYGKADNAAIIEAYRKDTPCSD